MSEDGEERYDIFLSYYSATGIDFARYLKRKLIDFGISAFLDEKDIPKSIKSDTNEWRAYIDKALMNSDKFVLIMTLNFGTRKEVLRELELAIDTNKEIFYCKHEDLPNSELKVKMKGETIDLSRFQYISFENIPDLLRKLGAELYGFESKKRKSIFMENVNRIIKYEGHDVKSKFSLLIEMVIGPTYELIEWFDTNPENKWIVSSSPYNIRNVIPRRIIFECETVEYEFFSVHTNGLFHIITDMLYDADRNLLYYDSLIHQILEGLIYCIRVMKCKKINFEQSVYIILRNLASKEITYDRYRWHRRYTFSEAPTNVDFRYQFNPSNDWLQLKKLFIKICSDLYKESGNVDISDIVLNKKLYRILRDMRTIHTTYNNPAFPNAIMPSINLEEFEFTNEEINVR